MTLQHCWAFEAGSIQSYILETGRLADAVGASLLVDRLTGDLSDSRAEDQDLLSVVLRAIAAATGKDCVSALPIRWSRRGGGAFIAFFDDEDLLRRTRLLWHAALHANAPGLRWADGVASVESASEGQGADKRAAAAALRACQLAGRSDQARLPEAGPLVLRVPRTGQPAATRARLGKKGLEPVDATTVKRRLHATARQGLRVLTDRFCDDPLLVWPRNMEEADQLDDEELLSMEAPMAAAQRFPFVDGEHEVAFLHADGNGLGLQLQKLHRDAKEHEYVAKYKTFSAAVSGATREAARHATEQILRPHAKRNAPQAPLTMPARPLVLGGDDLSMILRADLALPFAICFMEKFEETSRRLLEGMNTGARWGKLTAACGIAFVKPTFPFADAHRLAEHLCMEAKRGIKLETAALDEASTNTLQSEINQAAQAAVVARAGSDQALQGAADAKAKSRAAALVRAAEKAETQLAALRNKLRKLDARMPQSALAFQRVTTSLVQPGRPEVQLDASATTFKLGHAAYVLPRGDEKTNLPRWTDLEAFAEVLAGEASPRGPARKLLTDISEDAAAAKEGYRRWQSLRARERSLSQPEKQTRLDDINGLLQKLKVDPNSELPLGPEGTPWPDALLLAELMALREQRRAASAVVEANELEQGR